MISSKTVYQEMATLAILDLPKYNGPLSILLTCKDLNQTVLSYWYEHWTS